MDEYEDTEDTEELSVHAVTNSPSLHTILTGVSKPPSSPVPGTNPLSECCRGYDRASHGEGSRGHASSATGVGVTTRTWRKWRYCCHAAAQIFASCSGPAAYSPWICHHSFVDGISNSNSNKPICASSCPCQSPSTTRIPRPRNGLPACPSNLSTAHPMMGG